MALGSAQAPPVYSKEENSVTYIHNQLEITMLYIVHILHTVWVQNMYVCCTSTYMPPPVYP